MSKSFKITSGIKINVGKKSISTTVGKRGLSTNTGTNGTFINIGIPGTGIRYRKKLFKKKRKTASNANFLSESHIQEDSIIGCAVILGFIIGGAIFLLCGSFFWSFVPAFLIPILCIFSDRK